MCPIVGCYGDTSLTWLLGRYQTHSTGNIAPLAAYYHVWITCKVWWPQCVDRCPPYNGGVGCRHALRTIAAAQQLRIILTFWVIQRLPTCNYFVMGIYYQLLLCIRVVVASVSLYEVGYADIECADFTYLVLTSIYSRNRWDSDPADVKNGFSTKFWVG